MLWIVSRAASYVLSTEDSAKTMRMPVPWSKTPENVLSKTIWLSFFSTWGCGSSMHSATCLIWWLKSCGSWAFNLINWRGRRSDNPRNLDTKTVGIWFRSRRDSFQEWNRDECWHKKPKKALKDSEDDYVPEKKKSYDEPHVVVSTSALATFDQLDVNKLLLIILLLERVQLQLQRQQHLRQDAWKTEKTSFQNHYQA